MQNTDLVYKRVKKTLERHKNVRYPPVPSTIVDIQSAFMDPEILEKYGKSLENAKFYFGSKVTAKHSFTVFGSQFTIDFIQNNIAPESRFYVMDGTFGSLPKQFYQLLTITIEHLNNVSVSLSLSYQALEFADLSPS